MQCVMHNPLIFLADYTISRFADIEGICKEMLATGRPIVIIATDVEGEAYGTLLHNKVKGILNVCVVKAPNTYKKESFDDIAVLTGATVIRDDAGLKLRSAKMTHIGGCEKIIVTDRTTTIVKGEGKAELILQRKAEILAMIEQAVAPEQKEVREKRLAQVSGSVGVMYVGAITEVEFKEKYDRVDDALRAVKSAIEEGISCGGGVALLRCIDSLDNINLSGYNKDVKVGVNVVKKALEAPLRQMIKNAGVYQGPLVKLWSFLFRINEEDSILDKIKIEEGNIGYNVKTSTIEDLKATGIIDATKVVRCSIENAASVANTILTSEYFLIEMNDK